MSSSTGFRREIVESEKSRIILLNRKLIFVSILASFSLGIKNFTDTDLLNFNTAYILLLIPFTCVYIDILCKHLNLRILTISFYFQSRYNEEVTQDISTFYGYEKFCNQIRRWSLNNAFAFEDIAQEISTYCISLFFVILGIVSFINSDILDSFIFNKCENITGLNYPSCFPSLILCSGLSGLILTFILGNIYYERLEELKIERDLRLNFNNLIIHNEELQPLMNYKYEKNTLMKLNEYLYKKGVLELSSIKSGLFPAAANSDNESTGYNRIWVRDNIFIAYAQDINGQTDKAIRCAEALMEHFLGEKNKFYEILNNLEFAKKPMNRPHVVFEVEPIQDKEKHKSSKKNLFKKLKEIFLNTQSKKDENKTNEEWAHAQNDALGYFLWFYSKLIYEEKIKFQNLSENKIEVLALFILYFEKISYWNDRDSGHWEEARKREASSIGVVKVGLFEFQKMVQKFPEFYSQINLNYSKIPEDKINKFKERLSIENIKFLIDKGEKALKEILPYECREENNERRFDSALLLLIYPLNALSIEISDRILNDVIKNLQGTIGIKRYLGDSFWSTDYKEVIPIEKRTADFSDDIHDRDELAKFGQEAQWCIFDPIISTIYGRKFRATGEKKYYYLQTHYLNRSLAHITNTFHCPELYYISNKEFVHNDSTPLNWTIANLRISLHELKESIIYIESSSHKSNHFNTPNLLMWTSVRSNIQDFNRPKNPSENHTENIISIS